MLFDEHGRRIPYDGMRVHSQVSRHYFRLLQPAVNYPAIWERTVKHMQLDAPPSAQKFEERAEAILADIRADRDLKNLANGIRVPFLCPSARLGWQELLDAVGRSYKERFPDCDFMNLCPGKPDDDARMAPGSRYQQFVEARQAGAVIGIYFPNCLSEYDLASQRRQMETLPASVGHASLVLSGPADAAAALVGSPQLLWNEENYPHHLCLSAIQEPEDQVVYTFEAYGHNLRFRYRSNMLTPSVTQVSEQWAGGLTVFARA